MIFNKFKFLNKSFLSNVEQINVYIQRFSHNILKHESISTENISHHQLAEKTLKVSVIGMPNAGKSTFINSLIDHEVCPASNKVHTTQQTRKAVFTEGDTQVVFLDTPGLVSQKEYKKYNLGKSFLHDSNNSIREADIICVIHDTSNNWTRDYLDSKILRLLEKHGNVASFLVLNKIDVLKSKRKLLDMTRQLTGNCLSGKLLDGGILETDTKEYKKSWRHFSEVFMVSSLTGDGVQDVKDYLLQMARPSPWYFSAESNTDEKPEKLIVDTVRATLLDFLPQEIPYTLKSELEFLETDSEGIINTVVLVYCPSERIKNLVVGVSDGKLRQIIGSAQNKLWKIFREPVLLRIVVTTKEKIQTS